MSYGGSTSTRSYFLVSVCKRGDSVLPQDGRPQAQLVEVPLDRADGFQIALDEDRAPGAA